VLWRSGRTLRRQRTSVQADEPGAHCEVSLAVRPRVRLFSPDPAPRGCFATSDSPTLCIVFRGASVPTRATNERNKEVSLMSAAGQQLIRCSRLAAVAAVAAACLMFSGAAQASPPDPNTVGATTLSHIELNGELGTERIVGPGQDVKITANWADNNSGCPECVDFVGTAFAGNPVAGCIEFHGFFGESGSGEVDLGPAPKAPGTYNVVAQFEEQFECGATWNASESTGYQVIARVTVALPVPTNKHQCKKGGWRELTDSTGTPFKNQGQCVSFVEAEKLAARFRRHHH